MRGEIPPRRTRTPTLRGLRLPDDEPEISIEVIPPGLDPVTTAAMVKPKPVLTAKAIAKMSLAKMKPEHAAPLMKAERTLTARRTQLAMTAGPPDPELDELITLIYRAVLTYAKRGKRFPR